MIAVPFVILSLAAAMFTWRLLRGPSVSDRVIALDGFLATVLGGILIASAERNSAVPVVTVLLVALVGFVATGALARYVERRGG